MVTVEEEDPFIIYHGECSDGFTAAWIAKMAYPKATTFAALHEQPPPSSISGRNVFFLDFAYKRPILDKMREKAKSITVIDHHKTAEQDLKNFPGCIFDLSHSGAWLAWEYFKDKIKIKEKPWMIDYIQDRDLLQWKLPYSREINAVLDTHPMDFSDWDNLLKTCPKQQIAKIIEEGKPIVQYQNCLIDRIIRTAREVVLLGYRVLAANCNTLNPDVAMRLSVHRPFGIAWFQRSDGRYIYSLRSSNGFDVSAIASKFGGGGHENSAGFGTTQLVF